MHCFVFLLQAVPHAEEEEAAAAAVVVVMVVVHPTIDQAVFVGKNQRISH